jgi:hypothetical protein
LSLEFPIQKYNKIKQNKLGKACSTYTEGGAYRISVGKPEGKRSLGKPWCRWVDNIKMDLQENRMRGLDWIDLAQDRDKWRVLVNAIMNFRVP